MKSVLQDWVMKLPLMQQTVLLTSVRGPDTLRKYHPSKFLLRWYRRCILLSAMDGCILTHPGSNNGGSFTGPVPNIGPDNENWELALDQAVGEYLREIDEVPHHFQMHLMYGIEILGYKHSNPRIRRWWHKTYLRLVNSLHLRPEEESEMDQRLGDNREEWLKRTDDSVKD